VIIGTGTGTAAIADADDGVVHERVFARLGAIAATGDAARGC
jgi:hypothetical protein